MKESNLFKDGIYTILRDFIKASSIYKTTENPSGILTDEDLSNDVLDAIPSWEKELKLLDSIDLNSNVQSGETIDIIMKSQLLKRHVKDYVKDGGILVYSTYCCNIILFFICLFDRGTQ